MPRPEPQESINEVVRNKMEANLCNKFSRNGKEKSIGELSEELMAGLTPHSTFHSL